MRHQRKKGKLSRDSAHRKSMLRTMRGAFPLGRTLRDALEARKVFT